MGSINVVSIFVLSAFISYYTTTDMQIERSSRMTISEEAIV